MFLNNLRAGPADPAADFWFQPVSNGPTLSGTRVTVDTAMQLSTVYKCVRCISESLGMLPAHLYQAVGEKGRQRVRDNPVARLLANRPNAWQTPMQFRVMLEAHRSLRGNSYARVVFGGNGEPSDLLPLHPDRVTPEVSEATGLPRYLVRGRAGEPDQVLLQGEILHLAGMSLDGFTGLSPVGLQRESLGAAIAARDYGSRFWNNDARPPFWIKIPGKFEDTFAKTNFREEWQASYGGANRGKPAVLDRGMELQELGLTNTDSQWLESRKDSAIDICGLWRVPPHKIGILDRATWGNVEQQNIDFVTDALLPLAVSWEQTIFRDLLVDEDMFVEILLELLMRGDTKTRYEAYGKAITDGWMTRNEARALENRNPLDGLDEPLQPMNMGRANIGQGLPGGGGAGRAAALLTASAQRVARKEFALVKASLQRGDDDQALAASFAGHDRFVAEVLAVPLPAANAYCAALLARVATLRGTDHQALALQAWADPQIAALLRIEG